MYALECHVVDTVTDTTSCRTADAVSDNQMIHK